ncbi:MAG: aminopeptidase P family protein [Pirellulales bacterium]|nr:aminopeptidase P family protein [Pirellulales bacterium]
MTDSTAPRAGTAIVMAGIPAVNNALFHRLRFRVGDPAALVELPGDGTRPEAILILRDIEMDRARTHARADRVACPADYTPEGGLSGDRETATAQAVAECLRRHGIERVVADRTLPLIYAHEMGEAGIAVECDLELGVRQRRSKDEQEIAHLRKAQRATEEAMQMACTLVARATARADGVLMADGRPLTSERVRAAVDVWLLERGFSNPECIVAGGPQGADCHHIGTGELRTEQPVIIDIFPRDRETLYNGDCTRTVVHGAIRDELARMRDVVARAKAAAIAAIRAGVTGEAVHAVTAKAITDGGYAMGLPDENAPDTYCAMVHGTGHGVGLDVHEPPLLDVGGPELVVGDAVTVEPGLYTKAIGGVRLEDLVVVAEDGCENLGSLGEGLGWAC